MRVLVVDDEQRMHHLLSLILQEAGYKVTAVSNGEDAIRSLREKTFDFVILDIMMEEMDGFTACEKIRAFSSVPILMLTAIASAEEQKVKGLRSGADDYLVKPFSKDELLARMEAIMRRTKRSDVSGTSDEKKENEITFYELKLNLAEKSLCVKGESISLTRKEFDILELMMTHPNWVFSRDQLLDQVWGEFYHQATSRTVDTHMKTLRMKLGKSGKYIQTVWGRGYKLGGAADEG
ncbi:response regulator transcription factor [Alkalicoccus chagannorensis]|uniref:response regulator transcription factor n=1 Tax=Alkalicoccus chagannorensis TaxID=427072 RepID=UPI00040DB5A7|nr:response regulator transcription factor [Alkalicoccus chagannorensis]